MRRSAGGCVLRGRGGKAATTRRVPMSTIRRIALAITVGIAACCAAVAPAAPAHACGGYGDIEALRAEVAVRTATFAFMRERMSSVQNGRIHAVTIEGNTARVQ